MEWKRHRLQEGKNHDSDETSSDDEHIGMDDDSHSSDVDNHGKGIQLLEFPDVVNEDKYSILNADQHAKSSSCRPSTNVRIHQSLP